MKCNHFVIAMQSSTLDDVTTHSLVELIVAGVTDAHLALDAEARDDGRLARALAAEHLAAVTTVVLQPNTNVCRQ